jgi:pimeloyl-ACP methyl ester carboxylesterase
VRQSKTLFLHGGPGSSAAAERDLFGDSLPLVWWDQPRSEVLFARPYQALLDDVAFKAETLANQGDGMVRLVTHSFGAHLALHLAMVMPGRINSITMIAPVFNVADAIMRLGRRAASFAENPKRLLSAIEATHANQQHFDTFWSLVERLCEVPGVFELYWGPGTEELQNWFISLSERGPWLDLNTCKVILQDFWATKALRVQTTVRGPVNIVFGLHDVLVDVKREARNWSRYFPNLTVYHLSTGHFVHLESSPDLWLLPGD